MSLEGRCRAVWVVNFETGRLLALESARLEPWKRFFGGTNQGTDPLASFLRNFVTRVDFVLARSTTERALGKSVC
jgi:hypothetical protein